MVHKMDGDISVSSMAFCATATHSERAAPRPTMPFTVMTRSLSLRSMVGGTEVSTTVPSSFILTGIPAALFTTMFSMSSMLVRNSGA